MYNFRIRFRLPEGTSFNCEKSYLEIPLPDKEIRYVLYSIDKQKAIKDSSAFIIEGTGFISEDSARKEGNRVKAVLMWYGVKSRIGININKKTGGFSNYTKRKIFNEFGVRVLNYKPGVNVYPNNERPTYFAEVSGEVSVIEPVNSFVKAFQNGLNIELNDKEALSFELYNASCFESSINAKFLALIIAIESLIIQKQKNNRVVEHIDFLIKQTEQAELDNYDVTSLIHGLRELKKESISNAGRFLIKKCLGSKQYNNKSAEKFFKECYRIRGKLVHSGRPPEGIGDFSRITSELDRMVSDLLVLYVEERINCG